MHCPDTSAAIADVVVMWSHASIRCCPTVSRLAHSVAGRGVHTNFEPPSATAASAVSLSPSSAVIIMIWQCCPPRAALGSSAERRELGSAIVKLPKHTPPPILLHASS
eukprot:GHVU01186202.1.p1 GENE.GHVU01186202.1~~GHVU01186202.1.p1  ORF type:complete len:108 (-),score=8.07 GHVU01186202.1:909-1232(-)